MATATRCAPGRAGRVPAGRLRRCRGRRPRRLRGRGWAAEARGRDGRWPDWSTRGHRLPLTACPIPASRRTTCDIANDCGCPGGGGRRRSRWPASSRSSSTWVSPASPRGGHTRRCSRWPPRRCCGWAASRSGSPPTRRARRGGTVGRPRAPAGHRDRPLRAGGAVGEIRRPGPSARPGRLRTAPGVGGTDDPGGTRRPGRSDAVLVGELPSPGAGAVGITRLTDQAAQSVQIITPFFSLASRLRCCTKSSSSR